MAPSIDPYRDPQAERTTVQRTIPNSRQDLIQDRAPATKTDNLYIQGPSSSSTGFFQSLPHVLNQLHDDTALQRSLRLFLSDAVRKATTPELLTFGGKVLSREVMSYVLDAEKNPPYVKHFDTWGNRRDDLVTSTGWQQLQRIGIEEGMVAIGYENQYAEYSRVHHFAKYAIWCGSSAWVNCPSLMVDGVASLFRKHLSDQSLARQQRKVLQSAYSRLTSRDPTQAWTTGQWMTERQGGSDVSMTETLATYSPSSNSSTSPQHLATDSLPLGPYLLNGFKWFSSATDAQMVVLLARTPRGISLFYAPMRRLLPSTDIHGNTTTLNGISIQRLKDKLGTRALPTAELELKSVRAHLIGSEGKGTKEIASVLNIARIHNGVTAIGFWGRGLSIVRAFARVRVVGRKPLYQRSSYMRTLATLHVNYRANCLYTFFISALLGVAEQPDIHAYNNTTTNSTPKFSPTQSLGQLPLLSIPSFSTCLTLLRLLTPCLKGVTSLAAISALQQCMESLGGIGYLENSDPIYNIARLYRDANVLPIWEGTTDMMADDAVVRVLFSRKDDVRNGTRQVLGQWVRDMLATARGAGFDYQAGMVAEWFMELEATFGCGEQAAMGREEVEAKFRAIMERLVDVVMGLLLIADAARDGDEIAAAVVRRWFDQKTRNGGLVVQGEEEVRREAEMDLKIVFGYGGSTAAPKGLEEENGVRARL